MGKASEWAGGDSRSVNNSTRMPFVEEGSRPELASFSLGVISERGEHLRQLALGELLDPLGTPALARDIVFVDVQLRLIVFASYVNSLVDVAPPPPP